MAAAYGPSGPSDDELKALLAQCTVEEKIQLLSLKNFWETANIDRLDIPSLKVRSSAVSL